MRYRINAPTEETLDPVYTAECQFALEPSVVGLVERATEVGWDEQQVLYSLMCIAAARINDRTLADMGFALQ